MSQSTLLFLLLAFVFGGTLGFLLASFRSRAHTATLEKDHAHALELLAREAESEQALQKTRVEAEQRALKETLESMEHRFKSLASGIVEQNSETFRKEFLTLANQNFEVAQEKASKDLDKRKGDIEKLLTPMKETLAKLEKNHQEMEQKREGAYGDLKAHLTTLKQETQSLRDSSVSLSTALRGSSQARGRWGQISLRNLVEAAGMLQHCDFSEEQTLKGDGITGRADMLVRVPGGGVIPVDAKVPLAAYWDALECTDPAEKDRLLKQHVKDVDKHVRDLKDRHYSGQLESGVDFTVMFIPADPILAAAFERDPELQERAFARKVLIATPVTFLALLRTVSIYWQQQAHAENLQEIIVETRKLYERVATFGGEHLVKMGKGLASAVRAYNAAVGSYERRVLPVGKKLEGLEATRGTQNKLVSPEEVQGEVRTLVGAVPQESSSSDEPLPNK
ncbi:MAG: DNA recombination protein RmuC [Myxococcota bacterium]|nr:DNA recombination protein RmuC [Myxococcota bacterium]